MHGLANIGIQTSRIFQLLSRRSCTGRKLSQKSRVHQVVTNCCSCNYFPKIQKISGPSFCLDWFDFLLWFDLMTLQKRLLLMPETIHFGFAFECVFKCLNRKFIFLFSRRCEKIISFSLDLFLCCICLNRLVLVFTSKLFIATFSAVADDKLRSLLIIDLNFLTPHCCFRRPLSLWLSIVAAAERATLPKF